MSDFAKGVFLIVCFAVAGCGPHEYQDATASISSDESFATHEFRSSTETAADSAVMAELVTLSESDAPQVRFATAQNRKIIYNTSIGLVVTSYRDFESRLPILVAEFGGYVANNQTNRTFRDQQAGTWTVRVPVDRYTAFLNGVSALGFAEQRNENAQDVTEEFVDIEARIKNKKQLEERVLSILNDRAGKLADILEVERELSRVREAIERMEGRMRYLADRTSLATVTINCREEQEYQPASAPTLAKRISQAWSESIGAMQLAGSNLLVALIALFPWAVLFLIGGWMLLRIGKRWWPWLEIRRAV
ncbi:DUF4349 domain-containing protein [Planctomycetes bacterium K23_9]|uniref:DUF4349 domain-containing protein n=1 Tax=Stieleria marina TaxID=1930275 RepID=A0A517P2H0_9BACT|nr:hypothetical protein K239x_55940 [Planctomycetes bacterium K23_9]